MNIIACPGEVDAGLAGLLQQFEKDFTYPLGSGARFSIRHGTDYSRFFRAIGQAQCFFAEDQGRIVGAIAIALRDVVRPDGQVQQAAYIGDLKIAPGARGGRVLLRLGKHANDWAQRHTDAAFCVVMEGTAATPESYTGRAGLPAFVPLARLAVVRLPVALNTPSIIAPTTAPTIAPTIADTALPASCPIEQTAELFRSLSLGSYCTTAFAPQLRSEITPFSITLADSSACGLLEDTRRAKRLIVEGGEEMLSAHLSNFAYRSVEDGAHLLRLAIGCAAALKFPALFFAVREADAQPLLATLRLTDAANATLAPATVYGFGLPANANWNINTSEI